MKLNKQQYDALAPYEKHFDSAVNHRWTRFPGGAALDMIHDILLQVTGLNLPVNKCCANCILELMTEMGRIFLADRDEKRRTEVAVKESLTTESTKVEVNRKRVRKPKIHE